MKARSQVIKILSFLSLSSLLMMTWSQNAQFSQPLWSLSNQQYPSYNSKDKLFILFEGKIQVFDLLSGSYLTSFEDEVDFARVNNEIVLVVHELESERVISVYDALTLSLNWQKTFINANFLLAEHLVIISERLTDSKSLLNGYDAKTGDLVWSHEEGSDYNVGYNDVSDGTFSGSGSRPMTTSSLFIMRDIATGKTLEACGGRICASGPTKFLFINETHRLSTYYSTNALVGFYRFDYDSGENLLCGFMTEQGYTHENGDPYTDEDFENQLLPFQVELRSRTDYVFSDGISIVIPFGRKIYRYPSCDEAHVDNLFTSGEAILESLDYQMELLDFKGNHFMAILTNDSTFKVLEIEYADGVRGEFLNSEYGLSSQFPFSVFPKVSLNRIIDMYEKQDDYLSTIGEGVFEISDLSSGKSLLRIPMNVDIHDYRINTVDDVVSFQVYDDLIIVRTQGQLLAFDNPSN